MTDPEIARRCSVCGATIRMRAAFCPQCGQKVPDESDTSDLSAKSSKTKSKRRKTRTETRDTQIELTDPTTFAAPATVPLKPLGTQVESPVTEPKAPVAESSRHAETASTQALAFKATAVYDGSTRSSADTQALGAVGKLKKASTLVMGQAEYDPSVRFLLVAGILFVVFLLLVLLSKVIG